jgi:two-component system, LuxR family, sensor kinase FixL
VTVDRNRLASPENQRLLQTVLNTVLDGLITIDSNGTIETFNAAAARIFGYGEDEVIGQNVKMLMPDPYHAEHDKYLSNYMGGGKAKVIGIGREVTARRKDGSLFPMELGLGETMLDGQRIFVGTIRDISARKLAEAQAQKFIEQLQRSNRDLDDFAHIASHDLKEPLRGLRSNAVFLKEDHAEMLNATANKRLDRMIYLCERLEKLVNDLLYYSRLERQDLAFQKTDLNEVVSDVESMMSSALREKNAVIRVPARLPTMTCDRTRVTELFSNLVVNALKYNDKNEKVVEIGCRERAREGTERGRRSTTIFYVKDNGIGIEQEHFEEVFRLFKRLNTEDDASKGTGSGLTFVRKIVERHGGKIWIESEQGAGTTFFFTLSAPGDAGP